LAAGGLTSTLGSQRDGWGWPGFVWGDAAQLGGGTGLPRKLTWSAGARGLGDLARDSAASGGRSFPSRVRLARRMRMRLTKVFAAACAASVFMLVGVAHAQLRDEPVYYHFDDDFMVGDTLSTTPPLIVVRRPAARVMLLRPRASFVAEMLKSVEAL